MTRSGRWSNRVCSELSVTRQCELLGLPRSSYYYTAQPPSERDLRQMRMIDEEYTRHPFRGSRRMRDYLEEQGEAACRDRVRRLMWQLGLHAVYPKKRLSLENKEHEKYPYLLRGLEIARPNQVWCSDITYIRLNGGFVYLTAVMDWYSRFVLSLGPVDHARYGVLRHGTGPCLGAMPAGDLQHGSGLSVHESSIHGPPEGVRRANQHGRSRPLFRQHHGRAALAKREVRGGVPEGVCERLGLSRCVAAIFQVLQPPASSSGPRPTDAVGRVSNGRVGGVSERLKWGRVFSAPFAALTPLQKRAPISRTRFHLKQPILAP